jgi:hypothetical protein
MQTTDHSQVGIGVDAAQSGERRRLGGLAEQPGERVALQVVEDRSQPITRLGMTGPRVVVEKARVSQKQTGSHGRLRVGKGFGSVLQTGFAAPRIRSCSDRRLTNTLKQTPRSREAPQRSRSNGLPTPLRPAADRVGLASRLVIRLYFMALLVALCVVVSSTQRRYAFVDVP